MSGDWPDCEMPRTSTCFSSGGRLYSEKSEGAARATGIRLKAPQMYWA